MDTFDTLVLYKVRNVFDESCLVYHVRDLSNYDAVSALDLLNVRSCPEGDLAAACSVGSSHSGTAHDNAAGREVRSLDALHDLVESTLRIVDEKIDTVDNFTKVVRRNVGSHTNGDTNRSVYEQVRES